MKNQQNNGFSFQKEAMVELNANSLQSINSGHDTLYRTGFLDLLSDIIKN